MDSEKPDTGSQKMTCGDIVVHPTKPWPWIGTVQPKGDFVQFCPCCGGLRLSSISKDSQCKIIRPDGRESPIPVCHSHEDSPALQESGIASNGIPPPRCFGDCIDEDDPEVPKSVNPTDCFHPVFPDHMIPPPFVGLSVEGGVAERHFQVNWYPTGDTSPVNGEEKVVVPFNPLLLFQEGTQVSRKGSPTVQGFVKQVHRKVDAFVLSDYKWVIQGFSGNKLQPLMDIEPCPGCFVIHKGWVGTVYNAWRRITFRMEDGTEFTLADQQDVISAHVIEEGGGGGAPSGNVYRMFPGLKVRIRWLLLESAKWSDGYQVPETIRAKIKRSRDNWNIAENAPMKHCDDSCTNGGTCGKPSMVDDNSNLNAPADPTASADCESAQNTTNEPSQTMDESRQKLLQATVQYLAKKKQFEETSYLDEENGPFVDMENQLSPSGHGCRYFGCGFGSFNVWPPAPIEDTVLATVVKVEPFKLDVEWLGQVVDDVPSLPKGNVVEEDELKQAYIFRSSRVFEPVDLGVRHRYTVQPDDDVIPISTYRRRLLGLSDEEDNDDTVQSSSPRPSPGDSIYVAIAKCTSKVDVLWEDGTFEKDIDPEHLAVQFSSQPERDYFPAMYVTSHETSPVHHPKYFRRGKSDSGMDESGCTTGTNSVEAIGCHEVAPALSRDFWLVTKFGIVKKAKNAEKYATIAWYEMKRNVKQANDEGSEPVFLTEEDVSFYDLKFYNEYNYAGGTLVSRVNASSVPSGMPNVGYVLRKNPDASVQVVWYDGKEETTQPWKLRQLMCRYSSEYSASDVGDEHHYYSPTEHEGEDLEDLRYYDYSTLSAESRVKRIGLIVAVMKEVLLRLCSLTLILNNYFPYADRRKVVKLTLSCNDICNSFANLPDVRVTIREGLEKEQQVDQGMERDGNVANEKAKPFKSRYIREERLVWQCANWLYDWTEAMTTLNEDIKRYRGKIQRKTTSTNASAVDGDTTPTSVNAHDSETTCRSTSDEPANEDLDAVVSDIQAAIDAGLSTVTGILSVPASVDVAGGFVAEYLKGLTDPAVGEAFIWISSIDEFATLSSSQNFLRTLLESPSKLGRLPCFSYAHHSELELSALSKMWPSCQSSSKPVDSRSLEEGPKSCQSVLDHVTTMVENILQGRRDVSYADDDVLRLCNETADGLCLSVMSIMVRIIDTVYDHLKPRIERWLTEVEKVETKKEETTERSNEEQNKLEKAEEEVLDGEQENGEQENGGQEYGQQESGGQENSAVTNGPVTKELPNFELLPTAPSSHRFITKVFDASSMPKPFCSAVRREIKMLQSSLPPGIFVKAYENRMDLFSCMIIGPQGTPYADGVFFFDVRLKEDYPKRPPHLFYKSMSKLLNPNLYEDGMVCLSLLGTWDGKETELWTPSSTLLQVFVSIQSLILVSEPYFNEPGFEKEKGSQSGATKSRDYNEAAVLRTLESLQRAMNDPPEPFMEEMRQHILANGERLLTQLDKYQDPRGDNADLSFPLFPVTQGFCLCIKRHAENLRRLSERWSADACNSTQ